MGIDRAKKPGAVLEHQSSLVPGVEAETSEETSGREWAEGRLELDLIR